MSEERTFEVGENMIDEECPVCNKKFLLKEKIVLVSLQRPRGDYFINSVAIPVHNKCHWVDKE